MLVLRHRRWTPQRLPNLFAWYVADKVPGADGVAVSSVLDQSPNGRTLTQGTGSLQPLLKLNVVSGHAVLRFDGNDDQIDSGVISLPQPSTLWVVGKVAAGASGVLIGGTTGPQEQDILSIGNVMDLYAGTALVSSFDGRGSFHVFVGVFNGVSSALYVDTGGVATAAGNAGAQTLTGIRLGRGPVSVPLNGDIAEAGCVSGIMAADNIRRLATYASRNYALAVS